MKTEWLIFPLAFLLLLGLQSCSPRVIEHYQTLRDTTYITQHTRDSIFERDSVFVMQKADTVYKYVEKWRTRYVDRTDTLYQAVHDTTTVTTIQEVPRKKGWWDKTKDWLIWILLGGLVFAYRKKIITLIKML